MKRWNVYVYVIMANKIHKEVFPCPEYIFCHSKVLLKGEDLHQKHNWSYTFVRKIDFKDWFYWGCSGGGGGDGGKRLFFDVNCNWLDIVSQTWVRSESLDDWTHNWHLFFFLTHQKGRMALSGVGKKSLLGGKGNDKNSNQGFFSAKHKYTCT